MGYKQMDRNMTFAEASLQGSMEHNRALTIPPIILSFPDSVAVSPKRQ